MAIDYSQLAPHDEQRRPLSFHRLHVQWHPGRWEVVSVYAATMEEAIAWYRKKYPDVPKVQPYSDEIEWRKVQARLRREQRPRKKRPRK